MKSLHTKNIRPFMKPYSVGLKGAPKAVAMTILKVV